MLASSTFNLHCMLSAWTMFSSCVSWLIWKNPLGRGLVWVRVIAFKCITGIHLVILLGRLTIVGLSVTSFFLGLVDDGSDFSKILRLVFLVNVLLIQLSNAHADILVVQLRVDDVVLLGISFEIFIRLVKISKAI